MAGSSSRGLKFGQHFINESIIFFKSTLSFAFVNIRPVLPGHVLVSSIREAPRFSDLSVEEVSDLFSSTQKVSNALEKEYKATSLSIAMQDGPDAGQTVPHVHVHILPRIKGDFKHNDDIYKKLAEHDKECANETDSACQLNIERKERTLEDMALEASRLKSYFTQEYLID